MELVTSFLGMKGIEVMTHSDQHGVEITAAGPDAVSSYDRAVTEYLRIGNSTLKFLEAALKADPDLVMAHCATGYFQAFNTRWGVTSGMHASLKEAERTLETRGGTPSEMLHVAALRALSRGNLNETVRVWEEILVEQPHDVLALRLAHSYYFILGDQLNLRDSISRTLYAWDESVANYGYILGAYAFGLQETGDYLAGEAAAKRAVELKPDDLYGAHAATHVHEMQTRYREGKEWVRAYENNWQNCNSFVNHEWWHYTLFCVELEQYDECLAYLDSHVIVEGSEEFRDTSSVCSVLWRLDDLGIDVGDRWKSLADIAERHIDDHILAYADVFTTLALTAGGREEAAQRMLASMRGVKIDDDVTTTRIIHEIGLPIAEALIAYRAGDYARAVDLLMPIRYDTRRMGYSHVQRDIFALTLMQAAVKSGRYELARALLSERTALKPNSTISWNLYARALEGLGDRTGTEKARAQVQAVLAA
jgi:tetratricopeptide (TPR) repeat protein